MKRGSIPGRGSALTVLFALLVAAYLVTGSGRFHIVDEVSLFAVTESVAKRGALDTNAIAWTQWVNSPGEVLGAFGPAGDVYAKKGPAPAFLAVPFYLIGWLSGVLPLRLPPLSMLQTAFWFNAVVTALTAVLLARTVMMLGYRLRTALLTGALFGMGTIAWPYATHFFGEPLSALAIMAAFYALLRLRQTGALRFAAWSGLAAGVMIATSVAHAVLLVPFGAYLVLCTWRRPARAASPVDEAVRETGGSARWGRLAGRIILFAILLICSALLLIWYNWARYGVPLRTGYHFGAGEGFTANWAQGLWGLLLSPYRGFFWYTPLAIASVAAWPGFVRRHREEGWLLASLALILVALFGKWWMWWGGFAWGPRFLVPLAPLVVLVLAPWLDQMSVCSLWLRRSLIALTGLSVAVQLLAVSTNYINYEISLRDLYPTDWADPLKYGPPALWNPLHSPVLGQARLLLENLGANLDFGWVFAAGVTWEVPIVGISVGLLAGITWWLVGRRARGLAALTATVAVSVLILLALISALVNGERPEYGAPGTGYAAALAEIDQRAAPDDGIVTIAPYHYQVPMARYRGRLPIYGYATESVPLHVETEAVLWRALAQHDRIWLVTVGISPADPNNGVEAWLAAHAFKVEDRWLDDARLAVFATARRLEPVPITATLGNGVRLVSARISAKAVHPGDVLAVELVWQRVNAPEPGDEAMQPFSDLRGFLQLLTSDGRLVVGQDGVPAGGYAPSSDWPPDATIADQRGLLVPETLPAGEYALIAGLYDAVTGQRLPAVTSDDAAQEEFVRLETIRVK